MASAIEIDQAVESRALADSCSSCHVDVGAKRAFFVRGRAKLNLKCTKCSLISPELMRRSATVALIVGSALVALNQGDKLAAGSFQWESSWYKIPLTYLVPFCVATYGALSNGYRPASSDASV